MSSQSLAQGIQAIQNGDLDQGARLIRYALQDTSLTPQDQAIAWMWLATTTSNRNDQIDYYRYAIQADPNNQAARDGYNQLTNPPMQGQNPGNAQFGNANTPNAASNTPPNNGNDPYWLGGDFPNQTGQQGNPQNWQQGQQGQGGFPQQGNPQNWQQGQQGQGGFPQQGNPQNWQQGQQGQGGFPQQGNPQNWQQGQQGQGGFGAQSAGNFPASDSEQFATGGNQTFTFGDSQRIFPTHSDSNLPRTGALQNYPSQMGTGPLSDSQRIQQPLQVNQPQICVGITGGPNGTGTGFFVTPDGMIATSRYVVGGEEQVQVTLTNNQTVVGRVVRSFPALDLAFVTTRVQLRQMVDMNPALRLQNHQDLAAVMFPNRGIRGKKRATNQHLPYHWIPTTIEKVADAGGNPLYIEGNVIIGMLTRNSMRSNNCVYGLHISKILELLDQYLTELQNSRNPTYCFGCGILSQARAYGGYYCEACGATLSFALNTPRMPSQNMMVLYGETRNSPCRNCDSTVGAHKGLCMRCGEAVR